MTRYQHHHNTPLKSGKNKYYVFFTVLFIIYVKLG